MTWLFLLAVTHGKDVIPVRIPVPTHAACMYEAQLADSIAKKLKDVKVKHDCLKTT